MTIDTDSQILKKLDGQEKEEGTLPLLLQFYRQLLRIQSRAEGRISIPETALRREAVMQRTERGLPALNFNDLAPDWPLLQDLFVEVTAAFAEYPQLFGEIPEPLKEPKAGRRLTKKAVRAWFKGDKLPPALAGVASENILQAIIHATLKPLLASYSRSLIGWVDLEHWRRGSCPICGGVPDFAFLETERGARCLLCSRCDTEWGFQRLECPYCGTRDQNALAYFTDDEGLYRLYVCEQCKRYLKAIDLRQAQAEVLLPLERYYTLDLDAQAQEQGYSPHHNPA